MGIGFFLASPLGLASLDKFGIQGTFLIVGGINFQSCAIALISKPSSFERMLRRQQKRNDLEKYTGKHVIVKSLKIS